MDRREYRIDLIEESFAELKAVKEQFTAHFYTRLFEHSPQLEPLFAHTTVKAQGEKLYAALVLVVENLRHPKELERVLLPLGQRHIAYGVIEEHYPIICENLLATLAHFLRSEWTPDLKEAWEIALDTVTRTMMVGSGIKASETKKEAVKVEEKSVRERVEFELLADSFERIRPQKIEFSEAFYANLFEDFPELTPLFEHTDMKKQSAKLYSSLLLLVENIRNPETLEKVLVPLGARHVGYGVIERHYPLVCENLIRTLKVFLKAEWTPELEQTWRNTYQVAVDLMLKGYSNVTAVPRGSAIPEARTAFGSENGAATDRQDAQLSSKQIAQRSPQNSLLSKANDWFWRTPKWKFALGVAIFFFLLVPLQGGIPIIRDFLDVLEPLSIIIAVILYIKESPDRKKQFHYQAWSTIDAANGIKNSYARIFALQDLCDDNVSFKGLDLSGAELSGIELNGCDLSDAVFRNAVMNNAVLYSAELNNADLQESSCTGIKLSKANLGFASLHKANFSSADFSNANLMFANMSNGNFSGANFAHARLKGANFEGAYFSGADLTGAEVNLDEIQQAYLVKAIMPDGSIHE